MGRTLRERSSEGPGEGQEEQGEMVKTLIGLVPLAIGLMLFAVAVWFLLSAEMAFGRWLLAAFLVGHGLVLVMFVVPQPAAKPATASGVEYPFDMARSWLITGMGLDAGPVRAIGVVLVAAVVIGFALAGLATVGVLIPAGWWAVLVLGSAVLSTVVLLLFFSPGLILGLAIDAVLLWVAVAAVWAPAAAIVQRGGA
jgi:hypothetical protein